MDKLIHIAFGKLFNRSREVPFIEKTLVLSLMLISIIFVALLTVFA